MDGRKLPDPGYDDDGDGDGGYKKTVMLSLTRMVVMVDGRMGGRVRKGGGGSLTLVPVIKGPLPPCVRILQPKYRQKDMLPQNESNAITKLKDMNQFSSNKFN